MINTEGRHQAVTDICRFFAFEHLPPDLQAVSRVFHDAVEDILHLIPDDSAELVAGIRKLLEGKDCAVRAAMGEDDDE